MHKNNNWKTAPKRWHRLKPLARKMRKKPTGAEAKLWRYIRKRQIRGVQFRRQHAIERYIPDFCCIEIKLIIEVDGPIHQCQQEKDRIRQEFLESLGYQVIRFENLDVFNNIEAVLSSIDDAVRDRLASIDEESG